MSAGPIQQCCTLLSSGQECDYSNPAFMKAVIASEPYSAPAITGIFLTLLFLFLGGLAVRNMVMLIRKRRQQDIKDQLIMNFLTTFPVCCNLNFLFLTNFDKVRMIFWLDGPVQLFSDDHESFSPSFVTSLQAISNCFINYTLIYSSYLW